MAVRKNLKNIDKDTYQNAIYFEDDLTARRAKLAYEARKLKRAKKKINDTWVWDSKVLIKDLHDRIHNIKSARALRLFE